MSSSDGGIEIFLPRIWRWPAVGAIVLSIVGATAGYLTLDGRISSSERAVAELVQGVNADRSFHVEQRVRLWDRVNQLEQAIQAQREAAARLTAQLDAIDANVTRILNLLESRRTP